MTYFDIKNNPENAIKKLKGSTNMIMTEKETIDFFSELSGIIDDAGIYDQLDEDFQDKYNAAMERLRNMAGRDIEEVRTAAGDLISRSRLLETLAGYKKPQTDENGETRQLVAINLDKLTEHIERMPTAYDLKHVIELFDESIHEKPQMQLTYITNTLAKLTVLKGGMPEWLSFWGTGNPYPQSPAGKEGDADETKRIGEVSRQNRENNPL